MPSFANRRFEVAGAVIFDAMAQGQILSARWRADRVRLDEAERLQSVS